MRAVFFDFGGTLSTEPEGAWGTMTDEATTLLGITDEATRYSLKKQLQLVDAAGERNILSYFCTSHGRPAANADEFLRIKAERTKSLDWASNALETVRAVKALGLITGIVSNTDAMGAEKWTALPAAERGLFDPIVLSCVERVRKPNAKIFHIALERAGVAAQDAVFVGDSEDPDVLGPKAVGMTTVLYRPDGSKPATQADYVISSLAELLELPCLK